MGAHGSTMFNLPSVIEVILPVPLRPTETRRLQQIRPPNGRWWGFRPTVDHRRDGSMTEFVRELLARARSGLSREEIRQQLIKNPEFAARLANNRGSIYGIFQRLRHRNEVILIGDRYFATSRVRE